MQDHYRSFFYYILGFLPSLFFGLRFFLQWIHSEKKKKSHVSKTFWYLSLCGNFLLSIHYFIQVQYLLFLIQVVNGFIAWRNIALLRKAKPLPLKSSIPILLGIVWGSSLLFFSQVLFFSCSMHLIDISPSFQRGKIALLWHVFGGLGCLLFASRFWIQWWRAERLGKSSFSKSFWIISMWGSVCAWIYFLHIRDWVSCYNYFFGMIPYVRNFMLMKHAASKSSL